eukprot:1717501-Pyramimonas_sp.AAC.1
MEHPGASRRVLTNPTSTSTSIKGGREGARPPSYCYSKQWSTPCPAGDLYSAPNSIRKTRVRRPISIG